MKNPLITIIVVTYNSEQFILKTLNSILSQDYRNFQIIISDDYSKDNTILLCKEWILQNSSFCDIQLLLSDKNRGTAYNINKSLPYIKGEYVKIIAGDDEFCDNYFSRCVDFFTANPDAYVLTTNVIYIYEGIGKEVQNNPFTSLFHTNKLNIDEMYHTIMRYNVIFSPTCIMKSDVIRELGGFDERYPLCEDLFFYAKVLKYGKVCMHSMWLCSRRRRSTGAVPGMQGSGFQVQEAGRRNDMGSRACSRRSKGRKRRHHR